MLPSRRRRNHGWFRFWRVSLSALQSRLFLSWETEVFNEPLFKCGVRHSRYLKLWFNLGVGIGLFLVVMVVFLMLVWVFTMAIDFGNEQFARGSTAQSGQVLTFAIPGINVPWSDFPYMILATTLAMGIHELGHAMAAASEGVPIEHVAIFLACLIPGALVALNQESLRLVSSFSALRIYCAGIWHNVMCCAGCYLLLMLLPVILSPLYAQSQYPVVSNIDPKSPLVGHVRVSDSIVTVAGLQLRSPEDWFEILHNRSLEEQAYFNQSSNVNVIMEASSKSPQYIAIHGFCACSEDFTKHENRLFEVTCSDDAVPFYQCPCTGTIPSGINSLQSIYCLKAADVVKCPPCHMEEKLRATSNLCRCLGDMLCLFPVLNKGEVFVDIKVRQSSSEHCFMQHTDPGCERSVVFVGDLKDLFSSLQLTKYLPRRGGFLTLLPMSSLVELPEFLERLLMYTFSLSAVMALLNSTPVYYLDGELIFRAWLACNKSRVHPKKQKKVMKVFLTVGSTLTVLFLINEFIKTWF